MKSLHLLESLQDRGVRLWADGELLRYQAPAGVLTAEVLAEVREHKPALLELLASKFRTPPVNASTPRPGKRVRLATATRSQRKSVTPESLSRAQVLTARLEADGARFHLDDARGALAHVCVEWDTMDDEDWRALQHLRAEVEKLLLIRVGRLPYVRECIVSSKGASTGVDCPQTARASNSRRERAA